MALWEPVYVRKQRNGLVVRCYSATLAQGILSEDGTEIFHLMGKESLGKDYAEAEVITMAEYDHWLMEQEPPVEPDPEDTEPELPTDVEPETVLTRAELTEKVKRLEEDLAAAKAALGLTP